MSKKDEIVIEDGTVIPYLKKIQKIKESRDTPLEFFCVTSVFFHCKSTNFAISENTNINRILVHNF